jgi:hypothetical protein
VSNGVKVLSPALKKWYRRRAFNKLSGGARLTRPEEDFVKQPYDLVRDQIKDYLGNVILFGHMSFFTSALPCSPFFAFINAFIGSYRCYTSRVLSTIKRIRSLFAFSLVAHL